MSRTAYTQHEEAQGGPYANSPWGWWTEYGGRLDAASGVVFIPRGQKVPPCPFLCAECRAKGRQVA